MFTEESGMIQLLTVYGRQGGSCSGSTCQVVSPGF